MRYCIMLLLSIFTFLTLAAKDYAKLSVVNQTLNDTVRVQLQITNPICHGFTTGQILAVPSGGRFPYTYAWSDGSKSIGIFGLKEGTYSVTVTDALGMTATATGTVVQPQPINVQFAAHGSICKGTAIDYQANVTGGRLPYRFLWSNGTTSNTLSPDTAGTYFVTVTDVYSCSTVATLSVKEPFGVEVVTQPVQCFDFCDGSARAAITGGTRPYRYLWSNGSTNAILESLPVGTYTVTVTDANGCQAIASGTVTAPPDLQLNLELTGTCEANDVITATVNPEGGIAPYLIRWRVGSGDSIVSGVNIISNLVRGRTYGVTVTDQNGCRAVEDNIVIPLTSGLILDVNKRDIACAENNTGLASVTPLSGTAPYTYQWSNGATTATIINLRAGNYQVTVTDANGCIETDSVTITRQPDLLVELDAAASCENEGTGMANVVPRSGQAPYAFRWSDGQTTGTATNLTPGVYAVTVIDALGCMAIDSIEVPVIAIDIAVQIDTQNNTATVTPTGGRPPYTYLWSDGQTTQTATNLEPGQTYTVTVTDQNGIGCQEVVTIIIPRNNLTLMVQATPSCENPAAGTAQVTITGGVAPYRILWSDGQTSETATGLAPGNYTVTVTDAAGNTETQTVSLAALAFDFSLSSTQQGCGSTPDGSAIVTILEGTAPYTYQWSTGSTDSLITNLRAGTYKVTVTDDKGCTASKEVTINRTILTLTVEVTNAGCTGEATGAATVIPSGGTAPYSYEWTNGATTATIENLTSGTYEVIVTDAKGCQEAAFVNINKENINLNISSTNVSCNGELGTATVDTVFGGQALFSYEWSNSSSTTRSITGLSVGTYSVTVIDARGCVATGSTVITQDQLININIVASSTICTQNTGRVIAIPQDGATPFSFLWSDGTTGSFLENLGVGTYSVTVTDNNQCVGTATAQVIEENNLAVTASSTDASCGVAANGTVTITPTSGSAPFRYRWENRDDTTASIINLLLGTYKATVTDANGCQVEVSATVGEENNLNNRFEVQVNADNEIVDVATITTGGLQNYTYLWCNQVTTPNQSRLQLGAYTLTITDALGCQITDTLFVNTFSIMLVPNCDGTAEASIDSEACIEYAITWDNGQTGNRATGLTNGNRSVSAIAPDGTVVSRDFVIDIPEIQVITNTMNTTCPEFSDGTAMVIADNGVAPYTYLWSNDSTTATIRNLAPGNYVVTVTDSRDCSVERSVTIAPASPISVTIPEPRACEGESVTLSVVNNKPEDILTYRWTPSNLFLAGTDITATPTYTSGATGSVEVTITNQFGCTIQQSVDIAFEERFRPEPSDLTYEESCLGLLVRFNGNGQTGGYIWRFGDLSISDDISAELNPTFVYSQLGTYKVTLIPANGAFCRDTTQFDVVVKGAVPLDVEVQGDTLVCNEETTSLNVNNNGFSSVRWFSTNNELLSESTNFVAAAGTYRVVAQNAEGCSGERLVTVINQGVNVSLEDTYALCRGESLSIDVINLNENDLLNFQWTSSNPNSIDDPTSDMPTFSVNETTTFTATVTNQYGCSLTQQVTIEVKELPEIDGILASPDTINSGETSNISISGAKGNYTYTWDSDSTLSNTNTPSTIASPSQTNIYLVEITNEDGCSIKPEVRVVVFDLPCEMPYLYLPNAFTPNNDGVNDVLFVRGFHIERMNFIIYNRWGEKVFETQNQKEGWDGTYKGEPATGDVFGYYLEVDCIGNEINVFKGNITILR